MKFTRDKIHVTQELHIHFYQNLSKNSKYTIRPSRKCPLKQTKLNQNQVDFHQTQGYSLGAITCGQIWQNRCFSKHACKIHC